MAIARKLLGHCFVIVPLAILAGCSSSNAGGGPEDDAGTANDSGGPQPDSAVGNDAGGGTDSGSVADGGGGMDAAMTCDPVKQTGCPNNEKCSYTGKPPVTTCEATGTVMTGQLCGQGTPAVDDCVAGDICVSATGTPPHMCRQFCGADADCTQPAVPAGATQEPNNKPHCLIKFGSTGSMLCTVPCNPVKAAGASQCATGFSCIFGGVTGVPELTECTLPGTVMEGATCDNMNPCADGLDCVVTMQGATSGKCRAVCRVGTNADCTIGASTTCTVPQGNTMFGFCCPAAGCG